PAGANSISPVLRVTFRTVGLQTPYLSLFKHSTK
ncbi:MAG: hypothetical protein ACI9LY_002365, partial [Arenicella sp.]